MARQLVLADIAAAENALHSILLHKDEQALRHLQEHYGEVLYHHIYSILHEEIKTSVALCETFKKIRLLLGNGEPPKSGLLNWMLQIAAECAFAWEQEILRYNIAQALAPTGS